MSNLSPAVNETFLFSVSPIKDLKAKARKIFHPFRGSQRSLTYVVTHRVWSPITFKDNHRRKASFQSASLLAFDFDDGRLTIPEAIELVENWGVWAIIGTTKSHQKEKAAGELVQPPCDRFRLIFKASSVCTDREQYEYNMDQYIAKLPCDRSCRDGARFYFPCVEIVHVSEGEPIDWLELPKNYRREQQRQAAAMARAKTHRVKGTVPTWVGKYLVSGVAQGNRHRICYAVAAELAAIGYGEEEIVQQLLSSPLSSIGEKDVRHQTKYGAAKTRGAATP